MSYSNPPLHLSVRRHMLPEESFRFGAGVPAERRLSAARHPTDSNTGKSAMSTEAPASGVSARNVLGGLFVAAGAGVVKFSFELTATCRGPRGLLSDRGTAAATTQRPGVRSRGNCPPRDGMGRGLPFSCRAASQAG